MGSNKKRQQTISKRNRERAVEEKRRLKREKKQAARAERAAGIDPEQATPEGEEELGAVPSAADAPDEESRLSDVPEPVTGSTPESNIRVTHSGPPVS